MCLAQGHNTVKQVRLEPATCRSGVKHSTTEPMRFCYTNVGRLFIQLPESGVVLPRFLKTNVFFRCFSK